MNSVNSEPASLSHSCGTGYQPVIPAKDHRLVARATIHAAESGSKRRYGILWLTALMCGTQLAASCASDPGMGRTTDADYTDRIPEDARLVKEGSGEIGFRAASNGRVWLYDVNDREIRYQTDVLDGDVVRVVPQEDRVLINDRAVKVKSLPDDRALRLYFDGRRAAADRRDEPRDDPRTETRAGTSGVPNGAETVVEARGTQDLSYKARDNGRVYLYDVTKSRLVATFNVKKNQRFTVVPANDNAAIDGKVVLENKGLNKRSTYRLLFTN